MASYIKTIGVSSSGGGIASVDSVAGKTGVVIITTSDLTDGKLVPKTNTNNIWSGTQSYGNTVSFLGDTELGAGNSDSVIIKGAVKDKNETLGGVDKILASDVNSQLVWVDKPISFDTTASTKVGNITITQPVDLDTMESDIATNNAKVGITAQQASDITTNNAKISFDTTASTKVSNISVTQSVDLDTMESDIATNNAKVTSISDIQTRTASFSTSTGNQYNKCNSATAINATLNSGIPIGSTLAFSQANVGEVTFAAGDGVTLEPTGKKLVEGSATAICIDTDTYRLDGNLEDV
jgi:hypothetical protein